VTPAPAPPLWPAGSRADELLDEARRATLGVLPPSGPHATPVAVAWHGGLLWAVAPRRSLKVRSLRAQPHAGALVEGVTSALAFGGHGVVIDPLRPSPRLLPLLLPSGLAAARYLSLHAADALRIAHEALGDLVRRLDPGGLAPRALIAVRPGWAAVLDGGDEVERWGSPPAMAALGRGNPAAARHADLRTLPAAARALCDRQGPAALTIRVGPAPVVLPCRWDGRRGTVTLDPGAFALLPSVRGNVPACVTLAGGDGIGLAAKSGLVLRGALGPPDPGGRTAVLHADRAVWWRGRETAHARPGPHPAGRRRHAD
jgi:hypothetical protein